MTLAREQHKAFRLTFFFWKPSFLSAWLFHLVSSISEAKSIALFEWVFANNSIVLKTKRGCCSWTKSRPKVRLGSVSKPLPVTVTWVLSGRFHRQYSQECLIFSGSPSFFQTSAKSFTLNTVPGSNTNSKEVTLRILNRKWTLLGLQPYLRYPDTTRTH